MGQHHTGRRRRVRTIALGAVAAALGFSGLVAGAEMPGAPGGSSWSGADDDARPPLTAGAIAPSTASRFGLGLLIADRGNGRLLIVSQAKKILWRFPVKGSLPASQRFAADDACLAPDGKTIVANDEAHHVVDRIDIVSRKLVWQYGHYGRAGSAPGYLNSPDDAYPLANGDVIVSDINNCREIEISRAKKIVHQWGGTGV